MDEAADPPGRRVASTPGGATCGPSWRGDFLLAKASEIAASLGIEVAGLLAATIGSLCEGQVRELQTTYNSERTEEQYLVVDRRQDGVAVRRRHAASAPSSADLPRDADRGAHALRPPLRHGVPDRRRRARRGRHRRAARQAVGPRPGRGHLHAAGHPGPAPPTTPPPAELRALLGSPLERGDVERARKLVRADGAIEDALALARSYCDEAIDALAPLADAGRAGRGARRRRRRRSTDSVPASLIDRYLDASGSTGPTLARDAAPRPRQSIPYENLDVRLGREIRLDIDSARRQARRRPARRLLLRAEHAVRRRARGRSATRSRATSAGCAWATPSRPARRRTWCCVVDDQIVDVGFGSAVPLGPVPLGGEATYGVMDVALGARSRRPRARTSGRCRCSTCRCSRSPIGPRTPSTTSRRTTSARRTRCRSSRSS